MQERPTGVRFRLNAHRRDEGGLALVLAMIVTFLGMILGLAILEVGRLEAVNAAHDTQGVQALAAAEWGLERAKTMSSSQKMPWAIMSYNGATLQFQGSSDPLYQGHQICNLFTDAAAGGNVNATYSVVIEDLSGWLPTSGQYRIHSFGTAGPRTHHMTLDAQTVTYASFGWLTNSENNVYFATGDKVDGWVYTNDHLNIWGSPTFTGKVNSAASYVNYAHGGPPRDNPDFQGGLSLNSPTIDIATLMNQGHISVIRQRSQESGGIWLGPNSGRPYEVVFTQSGKVTIKKRKRRGGWQMVVNNKKLSDTNGAIYIEDTVLVKGKVNGQVTLATPRGKDINIINDLTYAYPPNKKAVFKDNFDPTDPAFDDKLGLISGGDIVVKKSWGRGWGDMYVMASILAVTGSFRNAQYYRWPQKTLHIYGGIAQDRRGPVGMVGGRGFQKDYKYDTRFMAKPPPHFPTVMYDYDTWNLDP